MELNLKSTSDTNIHPNNNTNVVQAPTTGNKIDLLHSKENDLESKIAVFRISSDYNAETQRTKADGKFDTYPVSPRKAKPVTDSVDNGSYQQRDILRESNQDSSVRKPPSNKEFQQNYKTRSLNKNDYSHDYRNNNHNHYKSKSNERQIDSESSESFIKPDQARFMSPKSERKWTDILKRNSKPSNISQYKTNSLEKQKPQSGTMKWMNQDELNPHDINSKIQSKSSRAKSDGISRDYSFQERLTSADTGKSSIGKTYDENLQKKNSFANPNDVKIKYRTQSNKRPFDEPKYGSSSYMTVNVPKSASKTVVKKCYHVRIPEPMESEAWFNSVFSFGDNYDIDLKYDGTVQITRYYWSNKNE